MLAVITKFNDEFVRTGLSGYRGVSKFIIITCLRLDIRNSSSENVETTIYLVIELQFQVPITITSL